MHTIPASPTATQPAPTTSAWSLVSWVCFGFAILAAVAIGGWWAALRPATSDHYVGPVAEVFTILGMGAAWGLSLACAALGLLIGLVGVVRPAGRTRWAWGAVALNAALLAVSLLLLHALSPS